LLQKKNRNSNLAKITISILVDFDKKIAIFDFDFKIVTALLVTHNSQQKLLRLKIPNLPMLFSDNNAMY